MENEKVNIKVEGDTKTLEILTGDALPLREPKRVSISGTVNAPFLYLQKREIEAANTHILVAEDSLSLKAVIGEKDHFFSEISGKLEFNPDFLEWGFNKQKTYSTFELSDFIKMNRFAFTSKEVAMKLSSELRNFKMKVQTNVEKKDDLKGNARQLYETEVAENSMPESFKITLPIFKGAAPQTFEVEVYISLPAYDCFLVSPEIVDYVKKEGKLLLGDVVKDIEALNPKIPIIYI